jgi:hypothetical protein
MSDDTQEPTQEQNDADMEAAFAASFDGQSSPEPEAKVEPTEEAQEQTQTDEPKQEEPATQPEAATQAPTSVLTEEQQKLLSAIPELERRLTQQVDRVAGNYGEIKRLLESMQKAAATPKGAADFAKSEDADQLEQDFPEIAKGIEARVSKALSNVKTGLTPEQFEQLYQERRAREVQEELNGRIEILQKNHPDRFEVQKSIHWGMWMESLPPHHREAVKNSQDPYYVSGMLSKFKAYRDQRESEAQKNQKRIENAVTPKGVKTGGATSISDDEAAQKAFDEQFKS